MRTTDKHLFFWATKEIYSNWHPAKFTIDGIEFNCSEQFMMYKKALTFVSSNQVNSDIAARILAEESPREQKALGRKVVSFDPAIWDEISFSVVYQANLEKFSQNPAMKSELLETGDLILVEASPYDNIWGIGLKEDDEGVDDPTNWIGENRLGRVLMLVRDNLRKD